MMRWRTRLLLTMCLVSPCIAAWSAVAVIAELGPTQPLAPLLEVVGERGRLERQAPRSNGAPDLPLQLPVRSPGLTVGVVQAREISLALTRPLFLIGADAVSLEWLAAHHRQLLDMNAVGMVVDA